MADEPGKVPAWWRELWRRTASYELRDKDPPVVMTLHPQTVDYQLLHSSDVVLILEGLNMIYVWKHRWGHSGLLVAVSVKTIVTLEDMAVAVDRRYDRVLVPQMRAVFLSSVPDVVERYPARY
jgi:hypothetical protein